MENKRQKLIYRISELLDEFVPPNGLGTEREQIRQDLHRQIFILIDHIINENPIPFEPKFDIYELMRISEEFSGEEIDEKIKKYINDIHQFKKADLKYNSDSENFINN